MRIHQYLYKKIKRLSLGENKAFVLINYYKKNIFVINHLIIIDYQNAAMEIATTIVLVVQRILDFT